MVLASSAQTKTTEALSNKYKGFNLYFYKNTLRMLNQKEDPELDELVKDIEKVRFLSIPKTEVSFGDNQYKQLLKEYRGEQYEEMMTSRFQGKKIDVFIRESSGRVKGTVILVSDSTNLIVLDILGRIPLNKASSFFQAINNSSDVSKRLKEFIGDDEKKDKKKSKKSDD